MSQIRECRAAASQLKKGDRVKYGMFGPNLGLRLEAGTKLNKNEQS